MPRIVRIGLLGMGTIGTGVARLFLHESAGFASRFKDTVQLARIADKTPGDRGFSIPAGVLTDDANEVVHDPQIDIVIELIGGIEPARTFVLAAIDAGKHVVSANKALFSAHGDEVFRAAHRKGVDVMFEGSVGGSIPILRALRDSLYTSRIQSIYGIVNGTTNYILTRMAEKGASYKNILRSAQEQGFAEKDPTADVSGLDSLQKLTILLRLGFRAVVPADKILVEGIEKITPADIEYARELGFRIKLLAIAKRRGDRIEARVHPAMIPSASVMADVKYEYNAIEVVGTEFGTQVFYGKGAGQRPTATVVVSDALDIASRILNGSSASRAGELIDDGSTPPLVGPDDLIIRHYVRMEVVDRTGVLAEIARVFAEENISIEAVIQKGRAAGNTVPLVIMTHEASEASLVRAVGKFGALNVVHGPVQRIRVEELS
jgi:homoserine dehydrogenase